MEPIKKISVRIGPFGSIAYLSVLLALFSVSCIERGDDDFYNGPINGLKPVYLSKTEAHVIEVVEPVALKSPGKIYTYGSILFINDLHSGIHVIDNADPANPVPLSFIKILGNVDIAVKANILYADNAGDLVALNIADLDNIQVVKRVGNVFPASNFPNQTGVYFECPDPSKGIIVGWEPTILEKVTCRR